MRKITLLTGGSRSGKSQFGLKLGTDLAGPRLFVATCPILDDEMAARIEAHQAQRAGSAWTTLEETQDLAGALSRNGHYPVILIDCLTLWINNLIYQEGDRELNETDIVAKCEAIMKICQHQSGHLIMISNEVGMGLVPENALARRFRDLSGRCQQCFAREAESVALLVAGLPLWVKVGNAS